MQGVKRDNLLTVGVMLDGSDSARVMSVFQGQTRKAAV